MSYQVFPNAFIIDVQSDLVYYDFDGDGDLANVTSVTVSYVAPDGVETPWIVGTPIKVVARDKSVPALIIPVTPRLPLPGCLGRFFAFLKKRKPQIGGTGTVSGTLNTDGAVVPMPDTRKKFKVDNPILVYPVVV